MFTEEVLNGKLHFLGRGYELLKQHKILKRKVQFLILCSPKGPETSWAQTIFPWNNQGTQHTSHPAFTVNNGITTTMYKICSTLTIMTSGNVIEHMSHIVLVCPLMAGARSLLKWHKCNCFSLNTIPFPFRYFFQQI